MNERARVLALFAAAACGESSSGMPPDSVTPDTTAPKIVSMSPTGNVPIVAKLSATFDEALDPATVSATTVRVTTRLDDSFPAIAGSVAYDADTKSVTFTPLRPLVYDAIYELQIGAVADTSGNAFGGAAVSFHAVVNAMTREVIYSNGQISSYNAFTLDTNGHTARYSNYPSPGTNAQWFDADDPAGTHFESDYSPDGLFLAHREYAAGNDGLPNTADDPVTQRDEYTYDADRRLTKFASHASAQVLRGEYMWTGRKLTTWFIYNDAGTDLTWGTLDDRGPQWREYTHEANGFVVRMTIHNNGADLLPLTGDDYISFSTTYEIDPTTFALTKQITYGGPGPDMTWLTNDDAVANYVVFTTDANGLMTSRLGYSSKGSDNAWFTSDDVVSGRLMTTYSAARLEMTRDSFNGPGNDNVWGTADDVYVSYTETTYDASGNRTLQRLYLNPGTDTVWHTPDDVLTAERKYDTTH